MNTSSTQTSGRLNPTLLMSSSAVFTGLLGVGASLFPQTLLSILGGAPESGSILFMNVAAPLYLGFAVLNWTARKKPIGGIYSRPVALGNFVHFFAVSISLVGSLGETANPGVLAVGTAAYALFAGGFGSLLFAGGNQCG